MNLIRAFVDSPVKVAVGALLLALFGMVALLRMPMQLTPEVQTPTLTIETRWPGASPQEVEQEIVHEQEAELKSVEGITKMTSESSDSAGKITLEFLVGTNMDEALLKVNSRLNQVREYPEDADQPVISTANANDRPIAWFILSARRPDDDQLRTFQETHASDAEISAGIQRIRDTANAGLAMMRLRNLAEVHPQVEELLPPDSIEVTKLRRFAEDEIEAVFERVPGVSQGNVIGGLEDELQVIVDPEKLAARSLTIDDVRRVLVSQNADTSGGDYWEGKRRYVVRTLGQFRSTDQVAKQLLAVQDGAPIYVGDVAEVELSYKKPDGLVRRFGESSIAVNALRETGANVLDVMDGLQEQNRILNETLLNPRGLQLTQVYDETEYIYSAVNLVQQNIFLGGALTMIVLMAFLHMGVRTIVAAPLILASAIAAAYLSPWFFVLTLALIIGTGFWFARGALVVGLAIPISIVGTFLVLQSLGRSLNVISLAGLAFAVGMLVDNAVVVLENIYRRFDELKEPPFTAAVRGTQEVWGAILSSTLTTVAVFLPIVFIQQEAGQLFRDIALAISAAVALSMLVAMTVIPVSAARLFHRRSDDERPSTGRGSRSVSAFEKAGTGVIGAIVGLNAVIQRSVITRLVAVASIIGVALVFTWMLWPKVEYLPTGNRNLVFGILIPPPGYNLDQLMEMGEEAEKTLKPYWDVDPGSPEAEKLDYPIIGDFFFVARGRQVFMGIRAQEPSRVGELIPLVQSVGAKMPGTFAVAKQSSLFEQGLTGGRTVEVEITGPDLPTLVGLGGRILGEVKGTFPPATQVRPVPSLDLSSPELHIEPKLVQSAQMGVSSQSLGYAANALVDGAYAGDYFLDGDKIDVTIIGQPRLSGSSQAIRGLPVSTPTGQLVPLEALADVTLSSGPEQINHRERVRAITIEVSPPMDMPLQDAMEQLQNDIVGPMIANGDIPDGYRVALAGTADKLRDAWGALQLNLGIALLITYLLMAALFESWVYPLVIILAVPVGAVGGVVGLNVLNIFYLQTLDVLTMLGFVILIGTVVNNPILIVDQALNLMRTERMDIKTATLEAVRTRIRPIFMTTTTTVLGLAPLVAFPGAGAELYRGLGSVVLGGLAVSTVVTLVLVPSLFTLTADLKGFLANLFGLRTLETEVLDADAASGPVARPATEPGADAPVEPRRRDRDDDRDDSESSREYVAAESTAGD